MKKISLMAFPILVLASCSSVFNSKTKLETYIDHSEASTSDYSVKISSVHAYENTNYDFYITLSIKNLTDRSQSINFSNIKLIREKDNRSYKVNYNYPFTSLDLDSEIEGSVSFNSVIPTSLEEHYYFSIDFKNINYKVHLYETPDELREDLTVSYYVYDEVVHTVTVKKGRTIREDYFHETSDHQGYVAIWRDSQGVKYGVSSRVYSDLDLYGTIEPAFEYYTTSSDSYTYITSILFVHSDGVVVLQDRYLNKEICIGNYLFHNDTLIKEIYLPVTVHTIYNGNFESCGNLKTIHFAGTEEQWKSITNYSTIPDNVTIVFNSSFAIND